MNLSKKLSHYQLPEVGSGTMSNPQEAPWEYLRSRIVLLTASVITPFLYLESVRIWNEFVLFISVPKEKVLYGKEKGIYEVDSRNPNLKLRFID